MKRIMFTLYLGFLTHPAFSARNLEAAAQSLERKTAKLGLILAPIGLLIAGIYYILGRQEASQKMGAAIMGIILILGATAIVGWFRTITG